MLTRRNSTVARLTAVCALLTFKLIDATQINADDTLNQAELPSIWGNLNGSMSAFRIMSEIRLQGEGLSYVAEEWADGEHKLAYRFDIVPLEGNDAKRKTLLVDGVAKESYFFEPYKCAAIQKLDSAQLGLELIDKFPQEHNFVRSGLGAIWLHALSTKRAVFTRATTRPAEAKSRSMNKILGTMNKFTIAPDSKFPYRINMYFFSDDTQLGNGAIDAQSLSLIHLVDPTSDLVKLSAKVIEIATETAASSELNKQSDLFKLPLGYGCARANRSPASSAGDKAHETVHKPPMSCYALGVSEEVRVCELQVVASMPARPLDDMDKWKVRTSSVRIVSGSLNGRQYATFERRDFAPRAALGSGDSNTTMRAVASLAQRKPVLRRVKRVWDLGEPIGANQSRPMYFELADHLQVCSQFRDSQLDETLAIEIPLTLLKSAWHFAADPNDLSDLCDLCADFDDHSTRVVGLSLDPSMMDELFASNSGYFVVRENLYATYRDITLEKRLDSFELTDQHGRVAWQGPVSLVRRFKAIDPTYTANSDAPQRQISADILDIDLDMYFFSDTCDQQLARVHLKLAPVQLVERAHLHRDLDIGPCLERQNSLDQSASPIMDFAAGSSAARHKHQLAFSLVYPIVASESLTSDSLSQMEGTIYERFLSKLIALSDTPLSPLQVGDLQVDIESDVVKISAIIHEWPQVFNYNKKPDMKVHQSEHKRLFESELKTSERDCAESCAHVECALLVYCQETRSCQLSLDQTNRLAGESAFVLEHARGCSVLTRRLGAESRLGHLKPAQLYQRLRSLVLRAKGDDDDQCPLGIELDSDGTRRLLVPSSIQRLRENELSVESSRRMDLGAGILQRADPLDESDDFVHVDFHILLYERKLVRKISDSESFPIEEASRPTYGDCEQLCVQGDCASFSYCPVEKSCLVSRLDRQADLEANSVPEALCYVFARVQLSKFHKLTSSAPRPRELQPSDGTNRPAKPKSSARFRLNSNRDCAIECMDSRELTCRSFVFCPASADGEQEFDCLLQSDWPSLRLEDEPADPGLSGACEVFRRSYLVDYANKPGRRLNEASLQGPFNGKSDQFVVDLLLDRDADACASECSTQFAPHCLAFHVCATDSNRLSCALLLYNERTSLDDAFAMRDKLASSEQPGDLLAEATSCTTFVPRTGASPGRQPDTVEQTKDSMGFLVGLLVVLFGLGLGYSLTWFLANLSHLDADQKLASRAETRRGDALSGRVVLRAVDDNTEAL